jgi:hypothetical protein
MRRAVAEPNKVTDGMGIEEFQIRQQLREKQEGTS